MLLKIIKSKKEQWQLRMGLFHPIPSGGRAQLKNILIPDSVIAIGKSAFRYCCIEQLKLPASLRYIGSFAFDWNELKSISFPKNIQKIGSYAFKDCGQLERIEFNGLPKSIGSEVFSGCTALKEIVIPQGSSDFVEEELFPI